VGWCSPVAIDAHRLLYKAVIDLIADNESADVVTAAMWRASFEEIKREK